jgi:hypothetical protein
VVRQLVHNLRANDYRWSTLLTGVIDTAQFQMRSTPRATATASNETPQRDAKRGGQ